ncbi:MAG: sn-glycerol-3-phosphate ABC transporter ATP-binding protein UgpC [Clostridium sp.]|jgi:multiple sugar transport system ATP-binding protein|uniref:ABC transporter ATP-binding protein n=1 Tax=Clostridium sp. TaxID=1506 RepID=UPI0025BF8964|nr:sn-glycerol-3-phosphate ABC transporter ATP-binding protein UgpC [Clostridium sp.]MCH3964055.1 sn-glycerol-3-phosphate ABC transporter ATP-binding protein UgpC [Clostridium sp.]MCI1716256.1 sn-glycerol-3-phosphate ABC transporter ATP-binding protein UgpC [Clostridium sp.]MCI1800504.1 sn-glycerol-3-phosphate ABC transporter ATP-binding protein UgpC [Clostridium sp.]MCI1814433.1 sn-glycerol-3-phosphate ABC transporter ATP-binding protein UgpC [Clostridium sp.]MCI1871332.1 sn-glycerol-3-phosph
MAGLSLKHVCKVYPGGVDIIKDFNLDIEDKEFIVFVGPSGCGKSTVLRMIAGLEEITEGELYIEDELVNEVTPKDRNVAMVFQNYALYPHMTVYNNMAFGLKMRKVPKHKIDEKVKEAAEILDISGLLSRRPKELSGGQRQRVAMGRAIVRNPKVFLMDEPLSNLDAKLRVQMRAEISKLYKKLKTTFIYVTHDQMEAMTLGTRIVVIKDGIIQQVDAPQEIYNHPVNVFVASFIGSPQMNFIDAGLRYIDGKLAALFGDGGKIDVQDDTAKFLEKKDLVNKDVIIGIRPENIKIQQDGCEDEHLMEFNVDLTELMGAESYVYLSRGNVSIISRVEGIVNARSGDKIRIYFDSDKIHIFDKKTQLAVL